MKKIVYLTVCLTFLFTCSLQAANRSVPTEKAVMAETFQRMHNVPSGVFVPEYNASGVLQRLYIQGDGMAVNPSHRPTAAQTSRTRQSARQNAERNARNAFVQFVRQEVSVYLNAQRDVLVVKKGSEVPSGYSDVTSRVINEVNSNVANNLYLRGRILLDENYDEMANPGTRPMPNAWSAEVVYGWSQKQADEIRAAQRR